MEHLRTSADFSVGLDEAIAFVRLMPLLQEVPEDTLKNICGALQPVKYEPGEPIVRLNSEGAGLYILWNGEIFRYPLGEGPRLDGSLAMPESLQHLQKYGVSVNLAKVKSPPNGYPLAHNESLLKRGDYFGIGMMGPARPKYKVDVVAITKVFCLVLLREHADLLSGISVWNLDSKYERPSKLEKILQLETVGAIGDMKMKSPGFPNYYTPYMRALRRSYGALTAARSYFGGQLVAQALLAATKTVDADLLVHSLHSYFILAADRSVSVVYEVERIRDGKSFATRHVKAMQNDKLVFVLYASFKREEIGFEHAAPMPSAPRPEEVISVDQMFDEFTIDPRLPLDRKKDYAGLNLDVVPIEMLYVSPINKFQPEKREPRQMTWIRSRVKLAQQQSFHRCVIAYATDLQLLETSLQPHAETLGQRMHILSLDHTIWFHRSFDSAEWLLFVMESPVAVNGLGLAIGKLYTQDGKLVMTVAQEGVIRIISDKTEGVAKL